MAELTYTVPGVRCGHCAAAITEEVASVDGVEDVAVDVGSKVVTVRGHGLSDDELRRAIEEAGYEAA